MFRKLLILNFQNYKTNKPNSTGFATKDTINKALVSKIGCRVWCVNFVFLRFMNIFIITSTWKFNKNIRVILSRKRWTLPLTGFAYICCFIVDKTKSQHQKRVTFFVLFSFSFVCLFCFSSVNIL